MVTDLKKMTLLECTKFVFRQDLARTLLGAHNITPVHCDLWTYGHLTSEAYHGVLFCDVNMFTKFYVSSF